MSQKMLVIVETHPIQYHAPVWAMASSLGIPVHVVYGCNFSVSGYHDKDFNSPVKWESSILEGYSHEFLPTKPNSQPARNYDAVTAYGLADRIRALDPFALLCCGYTHPLDRASITEAKRNKIKLMYRGEANDSAKERSLLKKLARDAILRRTYSNIDCFLSIGTEATNHYIRLGVQPSRIFGSPYAVHTAPFRSSEEDRNELRMNARNELRIALDAKVIIYSGKLTHRKGVDLLLAAVSLMPESERPIVLFLGDGELRSSIEFSTLPVRRVVLGFKPQDQLSKYFHAADVLVLPSRHSETWGLVVNEALEHGLPVIVSDCVGSRHDLVVQDKTGEIFANTNVPELARCLEKCINYPQSPDFRQQRRDHVKRFSIRNAALGLQEGWKWLQTL